MRRLAVALGHRIALRSFPGRGSVFSVTVALDMSPRAPDSVERPVAALPARIGLADVHVLLIENNPAGAEAMVSLLARWGCCVTAVTSAEDAIEQLAGTPQAPGIIIADLHLDAGALGFDAISAVHAHLGQRTPAFMITADYTPRGAKRLQCRDLSCCTSR